MNQRLASALRGGSARLTCWDCRKGVDAVSEALEQLWLLDRGLRVLLDAQAPRSSLKGSTDGPAAVSR